jgi:hypothetical protein
MSQQMVPQQPGQGRNLAQLIANLGQQSSLVARSTVDPRALAAGIKPSFASITFKGKVWGIRHRGVTQQLLTRDPTTGQVVAIPHIDVVIVKSATAISKTYYIDKYKEGDYRQPDCWSTNGQVPDPAAPRKQSVTCKGCQWDAFGSRTMDDGRKGKACADNKRVAVVPAADLKNEIYGGPMLLKLPPSSFSGLSELEVQLHQQGYTYFALVMRCSFDHTVAYPKVIFTPIGVLNDYQMQEVLNWQTHDATDRILNEEVFEVSADPEQPTPDQLAPQPQVQPVVPPQPVQPQHAAQPQPIVQPVAPQPMTTGIPTGTPMPATAFSAAPPPVEQTQPVMASAFTSPQGLAGQAVATPAVPPAAVHQTMPQGNGVAPNGSAALTSEQAEIARLKAELAAATAKAPRATRRRTTPVTPTGQQPQVQVQPPTQQPQDQPLPFTSHAQPPLADGEDDGDAPPDLDSRIDNLLNPGEPKP